MFTCKKCSEQFETKPKLMVHAKLTHPKESVDPVVEELQNTIPVETAETPNVEPVLAPPVVTTEEVQQSLEKPATELERPIKDLLMEAFMEMKDADSRAGLMQLIQDPLINDTIPQEVLRLCFLKVSDGDARAVIRRKLGLI